MEMELPIASSHGEEQRKAGDNRNKKLTWHHRGRLVLLALVIAVCVVVAFSSADMTFGVAIWVFKPIAVIVAIHVAYTISAKWYFRLKWWRCINQWYNSRYRSSRPYPLWPFVPEIILLTLLCWFTGGLSSVFISAFFVHATLGYYALERTRDVRWLTILTLTALVVCALLAHAYPHAVRDQFRFSHSSGSTWTFVSIFRAVATFNLAFAAWASLEISAKLNDVMYVGTRRNYYRDLSEFTQYLRRKVSLSTDTIDTVLDKVTAGLRKHSYRVRSSTDQVALDDRKRGLNLSLRLPETLHKHSKNITTDRIYEGIAELAAEAVEEVAPGKGETVRNQRLWLLLTMKLSYWRDGGSVREYSKVDPDKCEGFINCRASDFHSVMNDPERRKEWLALLPYCLRPTGCLHREELQCPRYDDPTKLCLREIDNDNAVVPANCSAYECYKSLNDNGVMARFIRNDQYDVPACVNEFRDNHAERDMAGVLVVCCPKAFLKNERWFTDPSERHQFTPVVFLSIGKYQGCKYYVPGARYEAGVETDFDLHKVISLFT